MKYSYHLMIQGQNNVIAHFISTDINLLEQYKNSILLGSGHISWEKGAIDTKHIIGLMDTTPQQPVEAAVKR